MIKVLVTGGAGYVGSTLNKFLLEKGYHVTVVDNLMYDNGACLFPYFKDPNFKFVMGDTRNESLMSSVLKDKDFIIHLASIVGYPACERNADLARSVNSGGTKLLAKLVSKNQGIIFASTGSGYGEVYDKICTEETPLNPISIYGQTKVDAEKYLLDNNTNVIVYRFATAFGLSLRMRLDLLINDFVHQAVINRYLVMFEKTYKRAFIHVDDMCWAFLFGIQNFDSMKHQVFNVGDNNTSYSKEDIALLIKSKVDYYLHFADIGEDLDKRNYTLSFDKINKLGFKACTSVEEGIEQLITAIQALKYVNPYRNA